VQSPEFNSDGLLDKQWVIPLNGGPAGLKLEISSSSGMPSWESTTVSMEAVNRELETHFEHLSDPQAIDICVWFYGSISLDWLSLAESIKNPAITDRVFCVCEVLSGY